MGHHQIARGASHRVILPAGDHQTPDVRRRLLDGDITPVAQVRHHGLQAARYDGQAIGGIVFQVEDLVRTVPAFAPHAGDHILSRAGLDDYPGIVGGDAVIESGADHLAHTLDAVTGQQGIAGIVGPGHVQQGGQSTEPVALDTLCLTPVGMPVEQIITQPRQAEIQAAGPAHAVRQAKAHVQQVARARQVEAGGEIHLDARAIALVVIAVVQHQIAQLASLQRPFERSVAMEPHRGGAQRGADDGLDIRGHHETGTKSSQLDTQVRGQVRRSGVLDHHVVADYIRATVGARQCPFQIGAADGIDELGGHLRGGILVDVDLKIAIHAREVEGIQRLGRGEGFAVHLHLQVRQLVHRRRTPEIGEAVGIGPHKPRHEGGAGPPEAAAEGVGHHVPDQEVDSGAVFDIGDLAVVLPHRQIGAADVLDAGDIDLARGRGEECETFGHLAGLAIGVPVDVRPQVHQRAAAAERAVAGQIEPVIHVQAAREVLFGQRHLRELHATGQLQHALEIRTFVNPVTVLVAPADDGGVGVDPRDRDLGRIRAELVTHRTERVLHRVQAAGLGDHQGAVLAEIETQGDGRLAEVQHQLAILGHGTGIDGETVPLVAEAEGLVAAAGAQGLDMSAIADGQ